MQTRGYKHFSRILLSVLLLTFLYALYSAEALTLNIRVKQVTNVNTPPPATPTAPPSPTPTPTPETYSEIFYDDCTGTYLNNINSLAPETGTNWVKVDEVLTGSSWLFSDTPNTCMPYPNSVSNRVLYMAMPEPTYKDSGISAKAARFCDGSQACEAYNSGLFLNYQDNNNFYAFQIYGTATSESPHLVRLGKKVAGTPTTLATDAIFITPGDVFRLERQGNDLKVYQNGYEILSETDTSFVNGGGAGILSGNAIISTDKSHTLNQLDDIRVYEDTASEARPTPTPTPTPTPPPSPTPTPPPISCNTTVNSGGSIQAAINSATNGQTVCLGTASWTLNAQLLVGSATKAITLRAAEGASPHIIPGTCSQCSLRVYQNSKVIGIEISGGWDGVKVTGTGVEIRDNYIHHNRYQGVIIVSGQNVTIDGNTIEANGQECTGWPNGNGDGTNNSPRHCHGIYISNPNGFCTTMTGYTLTNNILQWNPGSGIQFNSEYCPSQGISTATVSGNQFINNASGINIYKYVSGLTIQNNSFLVNSATVTSPSFTDTTTSTGFACINYWSATSPMPTLTNNTFTITIPNYVWMRTH